MAWQYNTPLLTTWQHITVSPPPLLMTTRQYNTPRYYNTTVQYTQLLMTRQSTHPITDDTRVKYTPLLTWEFSVTDGSQLCYNNLSFVQSLQFLQSPSTVKRIKCVQQTAPTLTQSRPHNFPIQSLKTGVEQSLFPLPIMAMLRPFLILTVT